MTPRQALNILVWVVLLPITIGIWAQFLPPCAFGCVPNNQERLPLPQQPLKRYTVCSFGGPCWEVGGWVTPLPPDQYACGEPARLSRSVAATTGAH